MCIGTCCVCIHVRPDFCLPPSLLKKESHDYMAPIQTAVTRENFLTPIPLTHTCSQNPPLKKNSNMKM